MQHGQQQVLGAHKLVTKVLRLLARAVDGPFNSFGQRRPRIRRVRAGRGKTQSLELDAAAREHSCRQALAFPHQAEQQVLRL